METSSPLRLTLTNGFDTLKDSMIVILNDSTELPVARGRRSVSIARWNSRVGPPVPVVECNLPDGGYSSLHLSANAM